MPLQKAHNARMNEDYNQRWMSETGFSQLKQDNGEKLRSRSWHGQFRELTRNCIVHNLTQAASLDSPPAPPSPDVSGRGIAVVIRTTVPNTIILILRQAVIEAVTASSAFENPPLTL